MAFHLKAPQGFGARLSKALGSSLGEGLGRYQESENRSREYKQKLLDEQEVKGPENERARLEEEEELAGIEKLFGPEVRLLWKHSPPGARNDIVKQAFAIRNRGGDIREIFNNFSDENQPSIPTKEDNAEPQPLEQAVNGNLPQNFKLPDYKKPPKDSAFNAEDWAKEKREWAKINRDIYGANRDKILAQDRDYLGIQNLQRLSEYLPKGLDRWLINPETGEFYGAAQLAKKAPKEVQEWTKEIARFQNRAKDAYGSRVTNFDLQQYMKQFPSLLNTKEGRERILQMLAINNRMDNLYDSVLNKIYQKSVYLPPEEADRMAQEMISDEIQNLKEQYLTVKEETDQFAQQNNENTPEGTVVLYDPNGEPLHVPSEKVEEVLRLGATRERK